MTREEIEAIRERVEKATEGPWRVVPGKMVCFDIYDVYDVYDKLDRSLIHREEDAKFIAHAREDIPKLLAEIERLNSVIARLGCETGEINHETTKLITPIVTSTANE
ncbi:ead/Ea22-like family protein [Brevibacillus laterosporus]|nr:ead/Ea22-like family protein [Brevibacillus laterosporus]